MACTSKQDHSQEDGYFCTVSILLELVLMPVTRSNFCSFDHKMKMMWSADGE